jgi:hypothetical protein
MNEIIEINSPQDVPRYFVFLKKEKNLNFGSIKFKNISAKTIYNSNYDIFAKFYKIAKKYNINIKGYINFYIFKLKKNENSIKDDFLNINTINQYCEYLKISERYEKIYKYFLKSANNIVDVCVENNYRDVREYLKRLILKNKLAEKIISGEISIYYLASIPNIKSLIKQMDDCNKNELQSLIDNYDKLNKDIQDAFMFVKSNYVKPIDFTNKLLFKKLGLIY